MSKSNAYGYEIDTEEIQEYVKKYKKNYYKEHIEEFIKEFIGIELFPWQLEIIKLYLKDPDTYMIVHFGRTPEKKLFHETINKIKQELL